MTDKAAVSPGPWALQPYQADHGASLVIADPEGKVLAIIPPTNAEDQPDMDDAKREPTDVPNGYLMAAAPDLLKACKAARISLMDDEHYQEFKPLIKTLEDAINRTKPPKKPEPTWFA